MSEWISVDSKLPEEPGLYLVFDGLMVGATEWVRMSPNHGEGFEWDIFTGEEVTHWMPIPAPPENDNG